MNVDFFQRVRDDIIGLIAAPFATAHPGVAVVYDNSPFDWNDPPARFVHIEIEWADADQLFLALKPKTRHRGSVEVTVYSKAGTGTREALGLLGWFAEALGYQSPGRVRLHHAQLDPAPQPGKGWVRQTLCVGWHADTD